MNKISTNKLFIIVSFFQMMIAVVVSSVQSKKIKKNATTTKFIQLGFALMVFLINLGQTALILKKLNSTNKGN